MIRCQVRLGFGPGIAGLRIDGIFKSTCDAVMEAMELYPHARRISAKAL